MANIFEESKSENRNKSTICNLCLVSCQYRYDFFLPGLGSVGGGLIVYLNVDYSVLFSHLVCSIVFPSVDFHVNLQMLVRKFSAEDNIGPKMLRRKHSSIRTVGKKI